MVNLTTILSSTPCTSGTTLAAPDAYPNYSADYYIPQPPIKGQSLDFVMAAYGPNENDGAQISDTPRVLDSKFMDAHDRWSVTRVGLPELGQHRALFCFRAHWGGANWQGDVPTKEAFELAVIFTFPNGMRVDFFVNVVVRATPPSLTKFVHWETTFAGLPDQNTNNSGYDLAKFPDMTSAQTTFLFTGNPSYEVDPPSTVAGAMVSTVELDQNTIVIPETPLSRGSVAYAQRDPDISVPVLQRGTLMVGIAPANGAGYTHSLTVNEPLQVRHANHAYILKVGPYVVDNSFSGWIQGNGYGDALGEGRGFLFYVNPHGPDATRHSPTAARLSNYSVDMSAVDRNTRVSYELDLIDPTDQDGKGKCGRTVTGAGAPLTVTGLCPNVAYQTQVTAIFTITGITQRTFHSEQVPGQPLPTAGVPLSTATPAPAATPTTAPTTTPTPTPASGNGLLAARGPAYAWVRAFSADADGTRDASYASTWAQNPHPQSFFWQAGRPLHLLPAVGEHPQDTRLTIHDDGNGNTALLYPRQVTTTGYTVDELGALAGQTGGAPSHCGPAAARDVSYAHVARYPQEIDPRSPRVALVWAPDGLAGALPPATVRCDVTPLLAARSDATLTLRYTVHQRAVYEAAFATNPPAGKTADDLCDTVLVPAPTAVPGPGEPPPAFATPGAVPAAPCPAPGVGLAAAEAFVAGWTSRLTADAGVAVTSVQAAPLAGHSGGTLRITVAYDRALTLSYHIVFTREVRP